MILHGMCSARNDTCAGICQYHVCICINVWINRVLNRGNSRMHLLSNADNMFLSYVLLLCLFKFRTCPKHKINTSVGTKVYMINIINSDFGCEINMLYLRSKHDRYYVPCGTQYTIANAAYRNPMLFLKIVGVVSRPSVFANCKHNIHSSVETLFSVKMQNC